MAGFPLNNQSPRIDIEFYGTWGRQNPPVVFSAAVDTGFTGGVSIPTTQALPLGLTLHSTAKFTLADGSVESTLVCLGVARLGNLEKAMAFSLTNTGTEILVGTELLAAFDAKLELDYKAKTFSLVPQP
jgi:predicted aspartyl protease